MAPFALLVSICLQLDPCAVRDLAADAPQQAAPSRPAEKMILLAVTENLYLHDSDCGYLIRHVAVSLGRPLEQDGHGTRSLLMTSDEWQRHAVDFYGHPERNWLLPQEGLILRWVDR